MAGYLPAAAAERAAQYAALGLSGPEALYRDCLLYTSPSPRDS